MPTELLSKEELERYSRHLILPQFGKQAQLKLKNSKVLVLGCGGLGAPVISYLAAAGVGKLGLVDFDVVEASNLQRQTLFTHQDVGKKKVEVAFEKVTAQNPFIQVAAYDTMFTKDNALAIAKDYDMIVDGTDNFQTRYLANDTAVLSNIPLVYASISQFDGQVSVFNALEKDGERGPNYRDLFPSPPPQDKVPNCAEGGVLGVLPAVIGSIQAQEAIKVLTGIGESLSGKLFLYNGLSLVNQILKISKNKANPLTGEMVTQTNLIDYESFCNPNKEEKMSTEVKSIDVAELKSWKDNPEKDFQLIDVREPFEFDICDIEGQLIPLGTIAEKVDEIAKDKDVVIHCRSGKRSADAILYLQQQHGFTNLYNLEGGILAWADEIDDEMEKY